MSQIPWPHIQRPKGQPRSPMWTARYDVPFQRALKEFAQEESRAVGYPVTQTTVLKTLALRGSARLRSLYKKHGTSPKN